MAGNPAFQILTTTLLTTFAPESHDVTLSPATTTIVLSEDGTSSPPVPAIAPAGAGPPQFPDYLLQTQFLCDRVLIPLVVCFGLVGNILSLIVLTRKEMASPTNCFLTALAISDFSILCLQIPMFFGLNSDLAKNDGYRLFVRYYTVILYVMINVFLTCTCWLTVAVTVERFLSLRFMMHPRLVCTLQRAKIAILGIFCSSFLFHFSKFFEYVPNTNLKHPATILPTELGTNKAYDTLLHIANISMTALIPMVALVIFNTFLIYFLATHRRRMLKHKSMAGLGGSSSGTGTTSVDMLHVSAVVVAVVLVFVACHALAVFMALKIAVHGRHRFFSEHLFVAFKHVNQLLIMVNSSINFLLYYSISRKFRKRFAAVFCSRLLNKATSWSAPVPLSENSMATAVSIRPASANGNSRMSEHGRLEVSNSSTHTAEHIAM